MRGFFGKKTQSLIEYSMILAIVAAALLGMHLYMRRGIQAVIKQQADQLGSQSYRMNNATRQMNIMSLERTRTSGTTIIRDFLGGAQTRLLNTAKDIYGYTHSQVLTR